MTTNPRRCEICGGFYEGQECPKGHAPLVINPLPPGSVVRFPWPSTGEMVTGMILTLPGDDEAVDVMVLNPHVRVTLEDVKEI